MGRVLDISASALRVSLSGWDKVFAAKGQVEVPLSHVRGAAVRPREEARKESGVLRTPGTSLPGKVREGTFRSASGDRQFWAVRRADRVLVIDLQDEPYSRIVLEVADPEAVAARIQAARGNRT